MKTNKTLTTGFIFVSDSAKIKTKTSEARQKIRIKPLKKFYKTYIKKHEMSTFSLDE